MCALVIFPFRIGRRTSARISGRLRSLRPMRDNGVSYRVPSVLAAVAFNGVAQGAHLLRDVLVAHPLFQLRDLFGQVRAHLQIDDGPDEVGEQAERGADSGDPGGVHEWWFRVLEILRAARARLRYGSTFTRFRDLSAAGLCRPCHLDRKSTRLN